MPPKSRQLMKQKSHRYQSFTSEVKVQGGTTTKWNQTDLNDLVDTLVAWGFYYSPRATDLGCITCVYCRGTETVNTTTDPEEIIQKHCESLSNCFLSLRYKASSVQGRSSSEISDYFRSQDYHILKPLSKRAVNFRLKFFSKNFPLDVVEESRVNSQTLAEAGFIYNCLTEDEAVCLYCDCSLEGWEHTDDPLQEHRRYGDSYCYFLDVLQNGSGKITKTPLATETASDVTRHNDIPKVLDAEVDHSEAVDKSGAPDNSLADSTHTNLSKSSKQNKSRLKSSEHDPNDDYWNKLPDESLFNDLVNVAKSPQQIDTPTPNELDIAKAVKLDYISIDEADDSQKENSKVVQDNEKPNTYSDDDEDEIPGLTVPKTRITRRLKSKRGKRADNKTAQSQPNIKEKSAPHIKIEEESEIETLPLKSKHIEESQDKKAKTKKRRNQLLGQLQDSPTFWASKEIPVVGKRVTSRENKTNEQVNDIDVSEPDLKYSHDDILIQEEPTVRLEMAIIEQSALDEDYNLDGSVHSHDDTISGPIAKRKTRSQSNKVSSLPDFSNNQKPTEASTDETSLLKSNESISLNEMDLEPKANLQPTEKVPKSRKKADKSKKIASANDKKKPIQTDMEETVEVNNNALSTGDIIKQDGEKVEPKKRKAVKERTESEPEPKPAKRRKKIKLLKSVTPTLPSPYDVSHHDVDDYGENNVKVLEETINLMDNEKNQTPVELLEELIKPLQELKPSVSPIRIKKVTKQKSSRIPKKNTPYSSQKPSIFDASFEDSTFSTKDPGTIRLSSSSTQNKKKASDSIKDSKVVTLRQKRATRSRKDILDRIYSLDSEIELEITDSKEGSEVAEKSELEEMSDVEEYSQPELSQEELEQDEEFEQAEEVPEEESEESEEEESEEHIKSKTDKESEVKPIVDVDKDSISPEITNDSNDSDFEPSESAFADYIEDIKQINQELLQSMNLSDEVDSDIDMDSSASYVDDLEAEAADAQDSSPVEGKDERNSTAKDVSSNNHNHGAIQERLKQIEGKESPKVESTTKDDILGGALTSTEKHIKETENDNEKVKKSSDRSGSSFQIIDDDDDSVPRPEDQQELLDDELDPRDRFKENKEQTEEGKEEYSTDSLLPNDELNDDKERRDLSKVDEGKLKESGKVEETDNVTGVNEDRVGEEPEIEELTEVIPVELKDKTHSSEINVRPENFGLHRESINATAEKPITKIEDISNTKDAGNGTIAEPEVHKAQDARDVKPKGSHYFQDTKLNPRSSMNLETSFSPIRQENFKALDSSTPQKSPAAPTSFKKMQESGSIISKLKQKLLQMENTANYLQSLSNSKYDLDDDYDSELTNFISAMPEEEENMTIKQWILHSGSNCRRMALEVCQEMNQVYEDEYLKGLRILENLPTKD